MYDDTECPYCEEGLDIDHDDGYGYEEGPLYEQECKYCSNIFTYSTSISYNYSAYKADCLNGGEHVLKKVVHYPVSWPDWVRCENCNYEIKGKMLAD